LALERGDVARARAYFDRAVAMNPRSSRAQAGVGNVALKRGDRRAAIAAWQRAVELDPANFDALYNVGITLARDGRVAEATPYLERFVRTAPRVPFAKELEEVTRLLRANAERGTR
jgi:protein O-GlcNAc transferase